MSFAAQDIPDVLPLFFKARMDADPKYRYAVVMVIDEGDTESDILSKLATLLGKDGKLGLAVFILPINEANDDPNNPGSGPLRLNIGFQVWEDRQKNKSASGTGISGYNLARYTFAMFKSFTVCGLCKILVPDRPAIEKIPAPSGKKLKGWGINFTGREDDAATYEKVGIPSFTPKAGVASTVAMSCPTQGSEIWYTTNGTPPVVDGEDSTLYAAPIAVPDEGFTIFATAFVTGQFPSDTQSGAFTKT